MLERAVGYFIGEEPDIREPTSFITGSKQTYPFCSGERLSQCLPRLYANLLFAPEQDIASVFYTSTFIQTEQKAVNALLTRHAKMQESREDCLTSVSCAFWGLLLLGGVDRSEVL